ncbi:hypothetical protein M4951_04310 [Blastopirellula sp. J2-11]|uniref:hypothetical protein n=1 Tax=Blastopirellula sp. J2-11 TaxID=2943192 RepID=UPI0021C6B6AE|nr:hypothetical protein [Blastopirellula sp. J2-11]UUO07535.1 hypothetical protein M4951_04310 [Blastopirellula sp. J2-11]
MKYVEFENQLQDLLDERRLSDVGQLLARVDSSDRDRCERLAAAYDTLFDGLESWNQPSGDDVLADRVILQVQSLSAVLPPSAEDPAEENPAIFAQSGDWLPIAALSLAASLLILAFIPFSLRQEKDDRIETYVATTEGQPDLNLAVNDDSLELLDWEDAKYVSPVRSPFDLPWELTSDLVASTTTAPRLPLDTSSLAVTSIDANPWFDTVQHRFRPLTQSMGSALMVIKDVTLPNSSNRNSSEVKPQARGAALPISLGHRVT